MTQTRNASLAPAYGLAIVMVLSLSACEAEPPVSAGGASPAAGPGTGGEQPKPAAGAAPAANQGPAEKSGSAAAPELTFSVNAGDGPIAYQGQPLVLEATLFHPHDGNGAAGDEPLRLSASDAATGVVRVAIQNERGERQSWPLHPYGEVRATITLEPGSAVDFAWWLTPEETAGLAPGEHTLSAVVDTSEGGAADAWKGRATSPSVKIRIEPEPATLSFEAKSARFQLQATYELLRGNPQQALARIDELLRLSPADVEGLEFRGDLLAREGKTEAALEAYEKASAAYRRLRQRPSPSLMEKQAEQLRKWTVEAPLAATKTTGPLEVAYLSADVSGDMAGGKVLESPFPTTAERLSLVWKFSDKAGAGAAEARWIAADGDRELARTKAAPDARSGELFWSKPPAGFAPGEYRVEVWQADQRLHSEKFTLTK